MTLNDAFVGFPTSRTLLVTVESAEEFYEDGLEVIERLGRGEAMDRPDTFSFSSVEQLFETSNPLTMALLRTIANEEPASIRETARLVQRDVKNVHDELTGLERQGLIRFEQDGRSKQLVFPYDEVVITVPFDRDDAADTAAAS